MKKLLSIALCVLLLSACNNVNERNNGDTPFIAQSESGNATESNLTQVACIKNDNPHEYAVTKVYVVKHDGCEYLMAVGYTWDSRGGNSLAITHSASCKNSIHGNNTTEE